MLKPYSAVPTNKSTHVKACIHKNRQMSVFEMQFPLSEIRRSATARIDGRGTKDPGQTMSLCHLWKGILNEGHENYWNCHFWKQRWAKLSKWIHNDSFLCLRAIKCCRKRNTTGADFLLPVYWNSWKQNIMSSSLNITVFPTSFWRSQCLDTEGRSVQGYNAMAWFIWVNTLTVYDVS